MQNTNCYFSAHRIKWNRRSNFCFVVFLIGENRRKWKGMVVPIDYLQKKTSKIDYRRWLLLLKEKLKQFGLTRSKLPSCAALLLCPIITFYLFDLYTHNPFTSMNFKTQLLNIVFYELSGILLFGIFRYVRIALMLQSGLFMIVGLANYYVLNFRSAPIMPWDIFSLRTAASVADNFNYSLEMEALAVLLSFLALLVFESRFTMRAPVRKRKRSLLIILPALLLCGYVNMVQSDSFVSDFGLYDKLFTPTVMNKRDGNVVAFLMEMEYLNVEKPEGYSATEMQTAYEEGHSESLSNAIANPEEVKTPNIIVIMDEAFSDLSVLGDFTTNEDYMPFIHGLQEGAPNTITGLLNVSVLGGNTANTEFEFLTGNTMGFLPQGSVAYQQYISGEHPSIASYLKELGYQTVAIHPYNASGWERNRVYPALGFDSFLSKEDFVGAGKLRGYISDEASFDKIIDLYEDKEEGEPLFVFNVTMQNHSGYDEEFANFTPKITVDGITAKSLPNYLSLMKETDQALEKLISYFQNAAEDTMIVFFGDHQPTSYVSNPILRLNGIDPNTLTEEENLLKYKVPYVIWSNFDMEEQTGQETSTNYLMIDVLENCGLPLPSYQSFLKEIRQEYPIITTMQVRDAEGNYLTVKDCDEALNPYRSMQYYLLFDYKSEM